MKSYSEEKLCSLAHDTMVWVRRDLNRHRIGDAICDTYFALCQSSDAQRLGIEYKPTDDVTKTRLLFEALCFTAFCTVVISPKYLAISEAGNEPNCEPVHRFNGEVARCLSEMCAYDRMTELKEIVVESVEPNIRFGFGDSLDSCARLVEYTELHADEPGAEALRFGKHIGKCLDPYHYPILELVAAPLAKNLFEFADDAMKGVFA